MTLIGASVWVFSPAVSSHCACLTKDKHTKCYSQVQSYSCLLTNYWHLLFFCFKDTADTPLRHWQIPAETLMKHYWHSANRLLTLAQTQDIRITGTAVRLQAHAFSVQIHYRQIEDTFLTQHWYNAKTLLAWCRYNTDTLRIHHSKATDTLQIHYSYTTDTLQKQYS